MKIIREWELVNDFDFRLIKYKDNGIIGERVDLKVVAVFRATSFNCDYPGVMRKIGLG